MQKILSWNEKNEASLKILVPAILFLILIVLGFSNFKDYGLAWDEVSQRKIGNISYNYIFKGDTTLHSFKDKDYGVGIELPLIFIEKAMQLEDSRHIFLMRHFVSHFFFLTCLFFGYLLIVSIYRNRWLAVLGVLFFALNPILYAHSFFNTKDIPFMAMYLVCFYLIHRAFKSYKVWIFLFTGMSVGFLVNLRIMGILLFLFVVGFILIDAISKRKQKEFFSVWVKSLFFFLIGFSAVLYISWPYLYENPIVNFLNAFANMSSFRWSGDVLYFGELIKATELPWHYGIVWMAITTPITYLMFGILGLSMVFYRLARYPFKVFENGMERHLLLYVLCLIAPIVAVIVFKSVLYDGWRHLYFVYPPLVLLALYWFNLLVNSKFWWFGIGMVLFNFVNVVWFMIESHPNQQVYFNALLDKEEPEKIRHQFELDYWGLSYVQALNAIIAMDDEEIIDVEMWNESGQRCYFLLPEESRSRIKITDQNPKYFCTEYRYHPEDYPFSAQQEVFKIRVQNNTILSVFKLRD